MEILIVGDTCINNTVLEVLHNAKSQGKEIEA